MRTQSWHERLKSTYTPMSPDEMEALSRRYSSATILLLPLASGRFALFDNSRTMRLTLEDGELSHELLTKLSAEWEIELRAATLHAERLMEMGLGEPTTQRQVRDLRRSPAATPAAPLILDLDSV